MRSKVIETLFLLICFSNVHISLSQGIPQIREIQFYNGEPDASFGKVYGAQQCGGKWNLTTFVGKDCDPTKTCKPPEEQILAQVSFVPLEDIQIFYVMIITEDEQNTMGEHLAYHQTLNRDMKKGKPATFGFYAMAAKGMKVNYKIQITKSPGDTDLLFCGEGKIQW